MFTGLLKEIETSQSAVDAFERFHDEVNSVFLDSGMSINGMGRYSFIARDPFLTFSCKSTQITITSFQNEETLNTTDPLTVLKQLLAKYTLPSHSESGPFLGGAIGYFGYDLCYILEKLPNNSVDDIQIPDCYFGFYDTILIFDHLLGKTTISSTGFPEKEPKARQKRAQERMLEMEALIQRPFTPKEHPQSQPKSLNKHFNENSYCKSIQKAIDYIYAGDLFQVNMTQRFDALFNESPFALYKRLRTINPAPYASYLHFPEVIVASASPERYLQLKGSSVETRPIKGTRPRGTNSIQNEISRTELWESDKDRAELMMVTDLARNDLGKVCLFGSIKVPDLIRLEEYPTVYHLVSTVTGTLIPDKNIIDLIRASFPGGSITGAPKIRAMELIDELEPTRRAIYTGSIGYIDFCGDADLNIVIRTFLIKNNKVYFQAGGGIVADSDPKAEYQESLDKARALMQALEANGLS